MVRPDEAPRLSDWATPTEAAEHFGVSRQTVNQMIKAGEFTTLHKIGPESRPQYVIRRSEVQEIQATRTFPRAKTPIR